MYSTVFTCAGGSESSIDEAPQVPPSRDAWSVIKLLRQTTNEYDPPPSPPYTSLVVSSSRFSRTMAPSYNESVSHHIDWLTYTANTQRSCRNTDNKSTQAHTPLRRQGYRHKHLSGRATTQLHKHPTIPRTADHNAEVIDKKRISGRQPMIFHTHPDQTDERLSGRQFVPPHVTHTPSYSHPPTYCTY